MNLIEEKLRLVEMSVNEVVETLQDRGEGVQLKASEMLRQQQEEIEALKMEIHSLTYGKRLAEYLRKAQEK